VTRTYVDAAPVIYLVRQVAPFWTPLQARLSVPGVVLVSSELTHLECLVLPLRNRDARLVADFDTFFASRVTELVQFLPAVFRRAAEIRAQYNFKTPDALHLAATVEGACTGFLTNDAQLTRFPGLTVEVV
jgi:predicted nucleic acid-binding protein